MLEQMRSMSKSPVAIILIGMLIVSFAVWGISDVFRGGQGDAVVIVGPNKVSVQDFSAAWQREVNRVIQQSEGKVTASQAREYGLAEQLLQRLTNEAALNTKAEELGIGMSDKLVVQSIRNLEVFKDPFTGKFGEQQYRSTLSSAGFTPEMFEREVRGDLLRSQITAPVVRNIVAPRSMAQIEYAFQAEQRRVDMLIYPQSLVPAPALPVEEELIAYLDANSARFQTPERRSASLVTISAQDLATEIDVPEETLIELFDFRQAELSTPQTRSWAQITAPDEASAKAAAERMVNGETAKDVAMAMDLTAPLEFTDNAQSNAPDDLIAEAVFNAEIGTSGASEGRLAWSSWTVTGITPAIEVKYEDVREQLRNEYINEEAEEQLFEFVGIFDNARASGATLEESAETANLLLLTLPAVDRFGRSEDGQTVQSFSGQAEILSTLFETDEQIESEIVQTANGDYFALKTEAIEAPKTPQFSDIRETVEQSWKTEKRGEAIKAIVDEIEAALNAGEDANAIAARYPGARVESAILQRGQSVSTLTGQHTARLFAANNGAAVTALDNTNENVILARVAAIIPAPPTANVSVDIRRTAMGETLAADMQAEFLAALLKQYNVRQDPRLKALALGDNIEG